MNKTNGDLYQVLLITTCISAFLFWSTSDTFLAFIKTIFLCDGTILLFGIIIIYLQNKKKGEEHGNKERLAIK